MTRSVSRPPQPHGFLDAVARLATSTRTWDELMHTVIDQTTTAVGAEVCSLYLVDRDGSGVTLAATNGLERSQVGVARLPLGTGITGRVAATRRPAVSVNVRRDHRFRWLHGLDEPRLTSMCSVPLVWNDVVIGVLNVQTVRRRVFSRADVRFLETLAALLAGIIEKGRLQREADAQLEAFRAIDEARARLVTIVTHDLRTPLAVVRAAVELLGRAALAADATAAARWEQAALDEVDRLDTMVDSILASLRVLAEEPPALETTDALEVVERTAAALAPLLRRHRLEVRSDERPLLADAAADALSRLLGYLLENAAKYAPAGSRITVSGSRVAGRIRLIVTDDGPGIPASLHERIFEPFARLDEAAPGAGIGLFAARHLARSMNGGLWLEATSPMSSRFVLDLAAAHGPERRGPRRPQAAPGSSPAPSGSSGR